MKKAGSLHLQTKKQNQARCASVVFKMCAQHKVTSADWRNVSGKNLSLLSLTRWQTEDTAILIGHQIPVGLLNLVMDGLGETWLSDSLSSWFLFYLSSGQYVLQQRIPLGCLPTVEARLKAIQFTIFKIDFSSVSQIFFVSIHCWDTFLIWIAG